MIIIHLNSTNMKVRIIERTELNGNKIFVIQQKFIFFWDDAYCPQKSSSFNSLEDAKMNLKYFNGTEPVEKVVYPLKPFKFN
jgi:hypothetical protein